MQLKIEGCIYVLYIDGRPYSGQSRVLNKDRLPEKRWRCHIADSKSDNPKMLYIHRAIKSNGLTYETLDKHVLEYVEHTFDCKKEVLSNIILKEDKVKFKKYIKIITGLLLQDDSITTSEQINEYIETEEEITEEELSILENIEIFVNKLNAAEEKWVIKNNSMMPKKGGNGYNHAPPGGAFLHEPHTEEHKKYMSNFMKNRKLSDTTKELLRKARTGKPLTQAHKNKLASVAQRRFNDEIFPKRVAEWKEIYTKLKCPPKSNSQVLEEKFAADWRQTMIKKKNNDINHRTGVGLTEEQILILEDLPGWTWFTDIFYEQFENFKKQYKLYNGKLNTSKKDLENPDKNRAINWIRSIRKKKKINDMSLTAEYITILNECKDWSWENTTFVSFQENIKKWIEFYTKHKRKPIKGSSDKNEDKLARWQSRIRTEYNNNEPILTKEKIDKLNSINGWTWK